MSALCVGSMLALCVGSMSDLCVGSISALDVSPASAGEKSIKTLKNHNLLQKTSFVYFQSFKHQ
jgi:uncharacterized protein YutE (UPF0331/DUF86 family)